MKKTDVNIDATYLVKVAGNLVPVKITAEHDHGGWIGTSVKSGKTIRIKSPQRLRQRLATRAATAEKASQEATAAPQRDTGERGGAGGEGRPRHALSCKDSGKP